MVHLAVIQTLFAQQSSPPPGAGMTQVLFLGLMFAAMYFLMIAPQRKKQKEHEKMLKAIGPGDEIVTAGGRIRPGRQREGRPPGREDR